MIPIERVARAIHFAADGIYGEDAFGPANEAHWQYWWNEDRLHHVAAARAAIAALEEPSEGMCNAVYAMQRDERRCWDDLSAGDAWRAMIRAAITEGE